MLAPLNLEPTPEAVIDYRAPRIWHILLATPMKERDAADWLKRSHVYAYWPNYVKQVMIARLQTGRLRRVRLSAVIPGYLFIAARIGGPDPWNVVRETPGINGYVRDGQGRPAGMEDADIEIVRRIEGGLNLPPPMKVTHKFKVGDKVRFIDDLLGRWPAGKIVELASDGRIIVEIPLLGRMVPIEVYAHQIEAM